MSLYANVCIQDPNIDTIRIIKALVLWQFSP